MTTKSILGCGHARMSLAMELGKQRFVIGLDSFSSRARSRARREAHLLAFNSILALLVFLLAFGVITMARLIGRLLGVFIMVFCEGLSLELARVKRRAVIVGIALSGCLSAVGVTAEESPSCADQEAEAWLTEKFGPAPPEAGTLTGRQRLETPIWFRGAEIREAKYAVSLRRGPGGGEAALSNLRIGPLVSTDAYGAGVRVEVPKSHVDSSDSEVRLFLHDVQISPNWPDWLTYGKTNYDGVDFSSPGELYGHAVRIHNWNADAALDIKADRSQFVDLEVSGPGNRPLRYWRAGPHDLIASSISRPDEGPLVWFADCDAATLRIHGTLFNGDEHLPLHKISCERGEEPEIIHLSDDPRVTGDVHPMLRGCPNGG
ncbi:MAG: hypothetical protein ABR504_13020 [Paracoccaceae bacterium]